jgi:hypothetical protein
MSQRFRNRKVGYARVSKNGQVLVVTLEKEGRVFVLDIADVEALVQGQKIPCDVLENSRFRGDRAYER